MEPIMFIALFLLSASIALALWPKYPTCPYCYSRYTNKLRGRIRRCISCGELFEEELR